MSNKRNQCPLVSPFRGNLGYTLSPAPFSTPKLLSLVPLGSLHNYEHLIFSLELGTFPRKSIIYVTLVKKDENLDLIYSQYQTKLCFIKKYL